MRRRGLVACAAVALAAVTVTPAAALPEPGSQVVALGEHGRALPLDSRLVTSSDSGGQPALSLSGGARSVRVWVVPVYWASPPSPAERSQMATRVAQVGAFYRSESLGRVSMTLAAVRPAVKVAKWRGCNTTAAETAARRSLGAAASAASTLMVVAVPKKSDCAAAGFAWTPGNSLWVSHWEGPGTLAHEAGHALFALGHAGTLTCRRDGVPVTMGPDCTSNEYGNPYDVMGGGGWEGVVDGRPVIGGLSAHSLVAAGLRPRANAVLAATTRTITLQRRDAASGATSVAVPWFWSRYFGTVKLWLEYRTPSGQDFWINSDKDDQGRPVPGAGVLITTAGTPFGQDATFGSSGGLLDMHPESRDAGFYRPGLRAGESFTTPNGQITIAVTATTSTSATVRITRNTPDTMAPIDVEMPRPELRRVGTRARATISWFADDNVALRTASVFIDKRKPVVFRNTHPIWANNGGQFSAWLPRGTHRIRLVATDYAGNTTTTSRAVTVR